jgi:hypothetical protein
MTDGESYLTNLRLTTLVQRRFGLVGTGLEIG